MSNKNIKRDMLREGWWGGEGERGVPKARVIWRKMSRSQRDCDVVYGPFESPHVLKVMVWELCFGVVPSLDQLARRNRDVNTCCVVCGAEIESVRHVLLECHFARVAWADSNSPWQVVTGWRDCVAGWVLQAMEYGKIQDMAWFVTMC
ncbi:hypothetical protein Salat_2202900 [Sesamum alatum]|uniref:Reverse transcriptase zinc-binding domain-containing protein n=1 Tax=Sesamum alatum TaxID=300844 RepID=A0AAE2CDB4_9LAMI|nr:hypothetical protein Salat_2202900 [Sesamum alatum]